MPGNLGHLEVRAAESMSGHGTAAELPRRVGGPRSGPRQRRRRRTGQEGGGQGPPLTRGVLRNG